MRPRHDGAFALYSLIAQISFAASGARLAAVLGHLLGTVVVSLGFLMNPVPEDALRSSELLIVFAYVVLLLVLLKYPNLQAPFVSPVNADYDAVPSTAHRGAKGRAQGGGEVQGESASLSDDGDRIDEQSWNDPYAFIAAMYRLTAREREILELLAKGRNSAFVEEQLCISRNTFKMHTRHIYTKLDIHSKQEIIDMVEQLRC